MSHEEFYYFGSYYDYKLNLLRKFVELLKRLKEVKKCQMK